VRSAIRRGILGGARPASYHTSVLTSRREIIEVGLAASALSFAGAVLGAPSERRGRVTLYRILYDTRFPESVAFAKRAAAHGQAVHAMRGDVTRFWYDDLYHRWRDGPAAIAGLTAYGALFCLEQLARDQRMRVVFRAERPTGGLAGREWAEAMADAVAQCQRTQADFACVDPASSIPSDEKLYAWVIAPRARLAS
jgi:hypothetical protein